MGALALSLPRNQSLWEKFGILLADVVTNTGLAMMIDRLRTGATYTSEPKYIGWGTGVTTAAVTDTTLTTEVDTPRVTGTSAINTTTVSNDTYTVTGTKTATATRAITEAGLFDASTSGNLFTHSDFSAINLTSGDSIAFTFNVVVS